MFPLDDILLGPASFGKRKGTEGIIWHTTEAADSSRNSAVSTATWQKSNPGSYNFIIYDGGILLTVPYLEASGGVNPASTSWDPGRYSFLRQHLSPQAYADPNAYLLNVAFSGKTAVLRESMPRNMVETAVALTRWVEAWAGTVVHSGHMHWQRNRSDPSDKVLARIAGLYSGLPDSSTEEPMPVLKPVRQQWTTGTGDTLARDSHATPGGQFWTLGPDQGDRKWFTAPEKVWSIAETEDGLWRAIEYGSEVLWMHRYNLRPVDGTRNPAGGYGTPSLAGHTDAELAAANEAGRKAGFADAKTKAVVAVQAVKP